MSISALQNRSIPNLASAISTGSSVEGVPVKAETAEDKFLAYAKMSPAERMRANLLSSMGLTEQKLAAPPPDQRKAIEEKIEQLLKEAAKKEMEKRQQGGFFTNKSVSLWQSRR